MSAKLAAVSGTSPDDQDGEIGGGIAGQVDLDVGAVVRRVELIAHLCAAPLNGAGADEGEVLEAGSGDVGVDAAEVDDVLRRIEARDRIVEVGG